ncbi:MAG: LysR substrate-binding domain-containing protein [Brevundimonas sp.]|jgi:LysR family glycine cleavage system transcriptional activator|uniref:LysR substrate-binding domain-containing protein n=1 Tax=Brevundimonas olei TaxID=657642 RepID=A0ABZ2IDC3_9CAUL|nr:LysR substrate-binding domain-containing protein [Brevundimonas sp.]MCH4269070.1 LysR substrate-binding domain-containing protein [Brevundimonas sp.]
MSDPLSRIPVDALRVFEAAARLLSFTRAAEALGMSQAAVSWRIRDLEQRLERPLFTRGTRQVALTPEGERLATAATEAMTLLRRAVAEVVEADQGVLAVTTLQTMATQWLATRLGAFQLANPDLAVRVDTSSILSNLGADGLDVALRFGSGRWPGLESRFLMPAVFTPVCTPALRDRLELTSPADLKRAHLIGEPREWAAWFAAAGVAPADAGAPPRLTADNQAMEVAAALGDQGVALGSPILYGRELERGLLVRPFHQTVALAEGYWLCYPSGRRLVPKIARFRDWILDTARADPAVVEGARLAGREVGEAGT